VTVDSCANLAIFTFGPFANGAVLKLLNLPSLVQFEATGPRLVAAGASVSKKDCPNLKSLIFRTSEPEPMHAILRREFPGAEETRDYELNEDAQ
jgi:hypothetical protein